MTDMWPGSTFPLGATPASGGTGFAVASEVADTVVLCLFDTHGRETQLPLPGYDAGVWHGFVPDVGPGRRYGYRVHGPYDPSRGSRCNPAKLLLDPYAKAIIGGVAWDDSFDTTGTGNSLDLSNPTCLWDVGQPDSYDVGRFPPEWSEWNGKYRDTVRDFWRSQDGQVATRVTGSPDLYGWSRRRPATINLITSRDGFTLRDLVSYGTRHNQANGEANRDGTDDNRSWGTAGWKAPATTRPSSPCGRGSPAPCWPPWGCPAACRCWLAVTSSAAPDLDQRERPLLDDDLLILANAWWERTTAVTASDPVTVGPRSLTVLCARR